MQRAQRAMADP